MRPSLLALFLLLLAGCDTPIEHFPDNRVYSLALAKSRSTATETARTDAAAATEAIFGTPNEPRWPVEFVDFGLIDPERLARAAGPVSSEKDGTHQGLYREHCVTCHGLAGSGAGPASRYQNPYPRNFRFGTFKWKSTQRNSKPTRRDLSRLLDHGVPGTAMPSFALLDPDDADALVDYAIYLSIRGEVERRLMSLAIDELDYGETRPQPDLHLTSGSDQEGGQLAIEVVQQIVQQWIEAEADVVQVSKPEDLSGAALDESIERGRTLFHGPIANCVGCHGKEGNGDALTLDYNDWDKEFSTRIGLTPTNLEDMRPFRKAGALPPRPIAPRRLADGVLRGGSDSETIYRRITQGIAGTPMPAVEVVEEENGKGLMPNQVQDLARYVQSLAGK